MRGEVRSCCRYELRRARLSPGLADWNARCLKAIAGYLGIT